MPAESKASNWIHRFKPLMWLLLLMAILLEGGGGNAADITMNCLHPFRDGQISIITCAVNTTSIKNAGCFLPPSRIDMIFTDASGLQQSLCFPQYPPTSCGPNSTAQACFCAENNTDVFTYQYNFLGSTSFQEGNFTCDICARPLNPPTRQISQNCTFIMIETTTSPQTTTTRPPEPCGKPDNQVCCIVLIVLSPNFIARGIVILILIIIWILCKPDKKMFRIVLIVLGVIFPEIGIVILIIWILWKRDKQKSAWCCFEAVLNKILETCCIYGIIVALVNVILGVIAIVVAIIIFKPCGDWCFIANIVLGCFCIAIGSILLILIIWKRKKIEVVCCGQQESATNPQSSDGGTTNSGPDDQHLTGTGNAALHSASGGPQHTDSQSPKKKRKKKKHRGSEESSLYLTELRSGSATSSESTSNGANAIQSQPAPLLATPRPLPVPKLPSVERNSAIDLLPPVLPVNKTLPPIMTNLKEFKEH